MTKTEKNQNEGFSDFSYRTPLKALFWFSVTSGDCLFKALVRKFSFNMHQ